jgi:hypothetical protein
VTQNPDGRWSINLVVAESPHCARSVQNEANSSMANRRVHNSNMGVLKIASNWGDYIDPPAKATAILS